MTMGEFFQRWLQLCHGDPGFIILSEVAFMGSIFVIMMLVNPVVYALDWMRRPFFPWKCEKCSSFGKDVTWRNNTMMHTMVGLAFNPPPTPWRKGLCHFYCDNCQEKVFNEKWPNWGEKPAMPRLHAQLMKDPFWVKVGEEMRRGKGAY